MKDCCKTAQLLTFPKPDAGIFDALTVPAEGWFIQTYLHRIQNKAKVVETTRLMADDNANQENPARA